MREGAAGDDDEETDVGKRFNPAPGWPAPPDETWLPPEGWVPDPSWPPTPEGWEVVVEVDERAERQAAKRQRHIERAQRLEKFVDPARAAKQPSIFDAYGGATGRLAEADRDYAGLRMQQEQIEAAKSLLAEQRETNRLLRALLEQRPQQGG